MPKNGLLNLTQAKLSAYGYTYLNGEWEFYPNQFLYRHDAHGAPQNATMIRVPGRWMMGLAMGQPAADVHQGSYRLTLTEVPLGKPLILTLSGMLSDYSVYANGRLVATNDNAVFLPTSDVVEIVIETQRNELGGLYVTPQLMQYDFFRSAYPIHSFTMIAFFADLAFSAVLFFILSFGGKTKRNYKYLFLFSLLAVLRYLIKVLSILPDFRTRTQSLDMEFFAPVLMLCSVGCVVCAIFMTESMYPQATQKKWRNILLIALIGTATASCFNWGTIYYRYLSPPIFLIVLLAYVYIAIIHIKAIRAGVDYALFMSIGTLIILFGLLIDILNTNAFFIFNLSSVLPLCVVAFLLMYVVILSKNEQKLYEALKRNYQMQQEVIDMESAAMAQRMQPHFLYNVLTGIQEMCYTEPRKAAEMIASFGAYLRMNIDFLKMPAEIPFSQELDFIENYVRIQQERIGKDLLYVKEIATTDFLIPPLSIEPLVENAFRHGFKNMPGEKRIALYVQEDAQHITIIIRNNGADFDVQRALSSTQGTLIHTQKRLMHWKNATLTLTSHAGTEVRICIPKEKST